jgi:tRNA (mo5U34)-methyltransferase
VELTLTVDRELAERVKASPLFRAYCRLRHAPPPPTVREGMPVLNGERLTDIEWYQTIDLGNGEVTPGYVDHRGQVDRYGLPASLAGRRCLDVATADGFWAFEMERRGAAEVVAIDVYSRHDCDFPTNYREEYLRAAGPNEIKGRGFAYARQALRSRVQRRPLSIYDLAPERVGTFDFVFVSDILLHLRDPLRALEAVWTVLRPGGEAIIADVYDPDLEATGQESVTRFMLNLDDYAGAQWWRPTTSFLKWTILCARFEGIEEIARLEAPTNRGYAVPKVVFRAHRRP